MLTAKFYRLFENLLPIALKTQTVRTFLPKLICAPQRFEIFTGAIKIKFGRRGHNPFFKLNKFEDQDYRLTWLGFHISLEIQVSLVNATRRR